jgi:hypothetical protein
MERLAEAVRATEGTFLIEDYADSEGCAAAVKLQLVAAGIPANRLFAVFRGLARARAPAHEERADPASLPRIELTRIAG